MQELTNAAFFIARDGKTDELGAELKALVEPTRRELGCIRYDLFQSIEDPAHWMVYEDWRSTADFDAHMRTPYVMHFMSRVPELCESDPEICAYARRG